MAFDSTQDEFTFDQRLGIYFSVQSASLSAASVTLLLAYALVRWLKRVHILRRASGRVQAEATDSSLFLNLMLADLLQAIGNMPSIKWMRDGVRRCWSLCTAQAVIKQIGINGVALTSLAIAVHTFSILVLRWRAPRHICKFMVIGVWVLTALLVGIPNIVRRNEQYYGNTGYWCWIPSKFKTEQILSEYLWVWFAAFSMIILYGIMFLVMRGFILIENGIHWRTSAKRVHLDLDEAETEEERESRAIANLLLFYPAVYVICVFPNSLARWLNFSGVETVPHQFTLFASALFAFSGMFNVILFVCTRPELVVGHSPTVNFEQDHETHSPQTPHPTSGITKTKYGHLPLASKGSGVPPLAPPNEKLEHSFDGHGLYETEIVYQSPQAGLRPLPPASGPYLVSGRPRTAGSAQTSNDDEDDYGRLP
ncbi:hypothetical protein BKA70DRAFT_1105730 [Coprinopsis sp. MPI-PUGE-AT-0042]|nr:hypothetical protein BKA70DRAFT_1105730 [Coprinopsis sp. MPI-PUGE-AT-0042]